MKLDLSLSLDTNNATERKALINFLQVLDGAPIQETPIIPTTGLSDIIAEIHEEKAPEPVKKKAPARSKKPEAEKTVVTPAPVEVTEPVVIHEAPEPAQKAEAVVEAAKEEEIDMFDGSEPEEEKTFTVADIRPTLMAKIGAENPNVAENREAAKKFLTSIGCGAGVKLPDMTSEQLGQYLDFLNTLK